ncbi:MAG: hypothetical protein E7215_03885 [Clostridium sulfidigenes]|uniref:Uncharacterized protein n=1 Tax=Clostridium sulfidigenes TaxID=318464 RepID=A0A927W5D9_9CLOT|nr:hypothetical protein [Clostridium sulfidigenes]
MFNTFIKCVSIIYVIKLVLKHNLFIHYLKIKIKFLGLDIEVKSKEKSTPSQLVKLISTLLYRKCGIYSGF